MNHYDNNLKISDIELIQSIEPPGNGAEYSSLDKWYNEVRKNSLVELSDGDVARFIRQDLYLEFLIPEALRRVSVNPLAGDMYSGEIINAMEKVKSSFWNKNPYISGEVTNILNSVVNQYSALDATLWSYEGEAGEFFDRLHMILDKIEKL